MVNNFNYQTNPELTTVGTLAEGNVLITASNKLDFVNTKLSLVRLRKSYHYDEKFKHVKRYE